MYLFENRISIENRPHMESYLQSFEYKASGLSFSSLYMWREVNEFSWRELGDYLCIAAVSNLPEEKDEAFLAPPLTRTGRYDKEALRETILAAREIFEKEGMPFSIRLLPFHMLDTVTAAMSAGGEALKIVADRPNYDYVYLTRDLAELAGRGYHGKKNHLNYFKGHYEYEYVPLTAAMAEEAMDFIRRFNLTKELPPEEMELLEAEERAMRDVFINVERLNYLAGAIRIDGKIEALTIGGFLGKNTVTVHVEKANIAFRGLYQAINNEFCLRIPAHIKYINREEDMGIDGLRKAKLSYKPVKLLEKYIVSFA